MVHGRHAQTGTRTFIKLSINLLLTCIATAGFAAMQLMPSMDRQQACRHNSEAIIISMIKFYTGVRCSILEYVIFSGPTGKVL